MDQPTTVMESPAKTAYRNFARVGEPIPIVELFVRAHATNNGVHLNALRDIFGQEIGDLYDQFCIQLTNDSSDPIEIQATHDRIAALLNHDECMRTGAGLVAASRRPD